MCMPTYFEASLQLSNNDQSTGALYLYDVQDTVLFKTKKDAIMDDRKHDTKKEYFTTIIQQHNIIFVTSLSHFFLNDPNSHKICYLRIHWHPLYYDIERN